MNNEEILLARKIYENLAMEVQILKEVKSRILVLEKEPVVQEYLNLVRLTKNNDKRNIISESFYEIALNTKDSNQLLVYMGAYKLNESGIGIFTDLDKIDYMAFEDLETGKIYKIDPSEKDEFEKTHSVIYLPVKEENPLEYKSEFVKLRINFYKELLNKPQEEVVRQLIKKD